MELQNQSQEYLSSQNVTNNFSGENQLNFKDTECTFNKTANLLGPLEVLEII